MDTRLYGVNGYSQDAPITHDVTITAGLAGVAGTANQFWVGYKAQPGYMDSNPGAGTSHIDFYNGDLVADCGATGDVTWDLAGTGITGRVVFNANAAGGSLHYENSNGMWLDGVVTSYRQINANTAVFVGTITDGSSDFVNYTDPDVFYVKVVDGGSNGDQIAVLANQPGFNDANAINADWDMSVAHGDVTSGDLVVN